MIFHFYSIRDELSGFMTPALETSDSVAIRNFQFAVDEKHHSATIMSFKPSDFSLYKVGVFDTELGQVSPVIPIELICRGSSLEV